MPSCKTCDKPILPPSPIATYENQYYHPDCLTCFKCFKSLSGKQFIKEKNGTLVCEECNEKYSPKCTKCNKSFASGEAYKKIGDNIFYHASCFKCAGPCRKPILNDFYDLEEGRFLCVDCYDKYGDDFEQYIDENNNNSTQNSHSTPSNTDDKFVANFDAKLTINNNPTASNLGVHVDMLPAVQRERENQSKTQPSNNETSYNNKPSSQAQNTSKPTSIADSKKPDDLNCFKCGQKLVGNYTVYNEKNYHLKCFVCSQCGEEFKEKTVFKRDEKPICRTCHSVNLVNDASKCQKCSQPILDTIVTLKNGKYHDYCLVCNHCSKKLIGQSIYTDQFETPFCIDCFSIKQGKFCAKCSKLIAPNQTNLVFENKNYHKECFTCSKCSKIINSSDPFYKDDDNQVICEPCAD